MPPLLPWVPYYNAWQPLAFFSKKLNPTQQKYSAYDRELLAAYKAVKYFRHMLEARHFIIFTDHKPITDAFQQKRDKCSPRQFNHLNYIAQFSIESSHILQTSITDLQQYYSASVRCYATTFP
jgi:hypothetical protein